VCRTRAKRLALTSSWFVDANGGEYGYDTPYLERMLRAADVLQADVTRRVGISELLRVDALCHARGVPLSLHCGPAIHLHPALTMAQLAHVE
jgi:L-alanine-DL-glutamate epimerase-like enolase superfamily enzyme